MRFRRRFSKCRWLIGFAMVVLVTLGLHGLLVMQRESTSGTKVEPPRRAEAPSNTEETTTTPGSINSDETEEVPSVSIKDSDGDGVSDTEDNCPKWQNPSQLDYDGDGIGYACDRSVEESAFDRGSLPWTTCRDEEGYISAVMPLIDKTCITKWRENGFVCDELDRVSVSESVDAVLRATGSGHVYLEFWETGAKLDVADLPFDFTLGFNRLWLQLSVSYIDDRDVYVSYHGKHEGYPSHYFFDGTQWTQLSLWDLVSSEFPDPMRPPFSLQVSPEYLKITEEVYQADTVVTYTPDRAAHRAVLVVDRTSGKVICREKIPR